MLDEIRTRLRSPLVVLLLSVLLFGTGMGAGRACQAILTPAPEPNPPRSYPLPRDGG
jgi:hypothetical protein